MKTYNVIYDKSIDYSQLQTSLEVAGCTILSNLSNLGVITLQSDSTTFSTVTGVIMYEEEITVTPEACSTWHLNRIFSRSLPMSSYYAPKNNGTGKIVYLVDSGVDVSHEEFENVNIQNLWSWDGTFNDTQSHGTAMASLIVGKTLGVAKEAILKIVKVPFGTTIPTTTLLSAFDAILADHLLTTGVKIINCSWTVPKSLILDTKINELETYGLIVVAAAGNSGNNADNYSPVGLNSVLGVAASDAYDRVISWGGNSLSNWGVEVDITAPGIDVTVADMGGGYRESSGTSLSAAIVSGMACIYAIEYPQYTAQQLQEQIIQDASVDLLFRNESIFATTPNLLAHLAVFNKLISFPENFNTSGNYVKAGETLEIIVQYNSPATGIELPASLTPEWVTVNGQTLTVTPPENQPSGIHGFRYYIVDEQQQRITKNVFRVKIYQQTPDDIPSDKEYYFFEDGDTITLTQASCYSYGCNGTTYGTCSPINKGYFCNCGGSYPDYQCYVS